MFDGIVKDVEGGGGGGGGGGGVGWRRDWACARGAATRIATV